MSNVGKKLIELENIETNQFVSYKGMNWKIIDNDSMGLKNCVRLESLSETNKKIVLVTKKFLHLVEIIDNPTD
tara:strand:+ start:1462 stop:1680 length:219 start_codon:yes stop_codon:yes gene_type:complete